MGLAPLLRWRALRRIARAHPKRAARLVLVAAASGVQATVPAGSPKLDAPAAPAPPLPAPPNIVVVVADDMGYGDLGCFGSTTIRTPFIDAAADEGARLTSAYAEPVCTPTRASLLTGRYARRLGMTAALGPWSQTGLDPAETTVAETLRAAGYRTALFGKWHVGDSPDQLPTAQGFDEYRGLPWGPTGIPVVELDSRTGTTTYEPDPRTQTRRATDDALDFIARCTAETPDQRFLCVVAYVAPHEPAAASPEFVGQSFDGRDYGDAVEELDASFGRIVGGVDALGIGDETLVLFLSDNGARTTGEPYENGSNGPLRGGKGTTLEGGVRVPAVARWTGAIEPGAVRDAPLHVVDLLPTFATLARAPLPPRPLDGLDRSRALVFGQSFGPERFLHFLHTPLAPAVRRGRYKLRAGALYDVVQDPGETVDLVPGATPQLLAVRDALAAELARIEADIDADPSGPTATQRWQRRWFPSLASNATAHLSTWPALGLPGGLLTLSDLDPALDVEAIVTPPGFAPAQGAYRIAAPSAEIRWQGSFAGLDPLGPFSVALRYAPPQGLGEPLALLDVGDGPAGLSLTVGDAGVLGDDAAAGRLDDVRAVVGDVSLTADLPAGGGLVTLVRAEDATLQLFVEGELRAEAPSGVLDVGLDLDWTLGAPTGPIGGSPSAAPFPATRTAGTIGALTVAGRALRANEIALERCRFALWTVCHSAANSTGAAARLSVDGSFRRDDRALRVRIEDAPPGEHAVLHASGSVQRTPLGDGYFCLGGPVTSFLTAPVLVGPDGTATFDVPELFDEEWGTPLQPGTALFLQAAFDDTNPNGPTTNTTNAVRLIWCRD